MEIPVLNATAPPPLHVNSLSPSHLTNRRCLVPRQGWLILCDGRFILNPNSYRWLRRTSDDQWIQIVSHSSLQPPLPPFSNQDPFPFYSAMQISFFLFLTLTLSTATRPNGTLLCAMVTRIQERSCTFL